MSDNENDGQVPATTAPPAGELQQADLQFLRRDPNGDYFFDELLDADGDVRRLIVTDDRPPPSRDAMVRAQWRTRAFEEAGDNSTFEADALVGYTLLSQPPYEREADEAALRALVESLPEVQALSAVDTRLQYVPNPDCPRDTRCDPPYDRFADVDMTGRTPGGETVSARFRVRTLPALIETVAEDGGEPMRFGHWREIRSTSPWEQ